MENEKILKKILSDLFMVDISTINDDTSVDTVSKWDSLKHLNLVLALEEAFKIALTEEQTVEILSYPLIKSVLIEHGIKL
ncbi:acyl carrier protein [Polynucleobacter bastaniensis]|uniref:acyl carrier protein n=1 Tax=Polynucleobacter bastaniensis TaxID=2081039 RepID=UPI001C0D7E44|nr:acyl carrier protein [Polynucleobacter bastaniensis]MBU3597329.1 acyl carrier protein [Polynucleobacter bastaniensis]